MKRSKDWFKDLVIYQIYPRSFMDSNGDGIGDLKGIISRLDYIASLGVNAIWLSPIYESPCYDNGYDISDYQSIDPMYGTFDDFIAFRDGCHERGIAVIMDLVINHTSHMHRWFKASSASRTGEYSDYYIWKDPVDGHEPNNWASCFGGSAWEWCPERGQYYLHLFAKEQPDLNWECEALRNEVFGMIKWWIDNGVDGFRVDAISYMEKYPGFADSPEPPMPDGYSLAMNECSNREGTHRIISCIKQSLLEPASIMSVGEVNCMKLSDYHDYASQSRHEFDMCIPFISPIVEISSWSPLSMKKNIIDTYAELKADGWWARFLSNHDKPRQVSLYGNDREYRKESAKMLASIMHMLPGTPFVFQGEELAMADIRYDSIDDYDDIDTKNVYREMILSGKSEAEALDIAAAVSRDNARTPMQWSAERNAGFSEGTPWLGVNPDYKDVNVEKELDDPGSVLSFYRELIHLRRDSECIRRGDLSFQLEDDPYLFVFSRTLGDESYMVIANFSDARRPCHADVPSCDVIMSNYGRESVSSDMDLEPYEAVIVKVKQ